MIKVTAAILINNSKLLIAKRAAGQHLAYMWELPGGKVEPGETPEVCLKREMYEEFSIKVKVEDFFCRSVYNYDMKQIELLAYFVNWISGMIKPTVHDEIKWVTVNDFDQYNFAPADIPIIDKLVNNWPRHFKLGG